MKLPSLNPWLIIRWSFVALLFAGTIAVAVDQVATRDRKVSELKSKITAMQKSIDKSGPEIYRLNGLIDQHEDANSELLGMSTRMQNLTNELQKNHEREIQAYKTQIALSNLKAATVSVGSSSQLSTPPATPVLAQPAAVSRQSKESGNPFWNTFQGATIMKTIKADADREWGKDYKMVEYEQGKQKAAYEEILEYKKSYNKVTQGVVADAFTQWGTNYKMVVYEIKKQLAAKQRLDGR